jgi:hypothetical protein
MSINLNISIDHSPLLYTNFVAEFIHKLKDYQDHKISLFGAGKNGLFIASILNSANIPLHNIYDDSATGLILGKTIKKQPEVFEADEILLLTISPHSSFYWSCLKSLDTRVKTLVLGEGKIVSPTETQQSSTVVESDGPLAHTLTDYNLSQYRDQRISSYRDKHKGQTCVIIGNGPSLNKTDFSLLKGLTTFALNKAHMLYENKKFTPDYLCCYIKDVISQCKDELIKFNHIPTFLSHESLDTIPPDYEHIHHLGPHKRFCFSQNPMEEICAGFTVTYVAMQLAVYMGFTKIILIGVDHNFGKFEGNGDDWVKIDQPRNTHFDPSYFNKDQFWQTPNFKMIEAHFSYAKAACDHLGVDIVDATIDGQLKIFPKSNLADVVSSLTKGDSNE